MQAEANSQFREAESYKNIVSSVDNTKETIKDINQGQELAAAR